MDPLVEPSQLSSAFLLFALFLPVVYFLRFLFQRPKFPPGSPILINEYPIVGAWTFFSRRHEFWRKGTALSRTGNFSFYVGKFPVVSITGLEARKLFFERKDFSFSEGYAVLFGSSPKVSVKNADGSETAGVSGSFDTYFNSRVIRLMKAERISGSLNLLISDARQTMDRLAKADIKLVDPFDDIYRLVYKLTVRMVACNEIAEDPELLDQSLKAFETIDASTTASTVIFPWLPTPSFIRTKLAGVRLYMMIKKILEARKQNGVRVDDALQYLVDQGDRVEEIIAFVVGALYAGVLNTGINAARILVYLSTDSHWMNNVRQEVDEVVAKYRSDPNELKVDTLARLTPEAWEKEFPNIDLCLRESIRMNMTGTAFRKNISGTDIPIGKEIIPKDSYVTYSIDDIHFNTEVYSDPEKWDPSRYLAPRAEDKKVSHAYVGWGLGRHPCLGMRFAKLEIFIIVSLFVAMLDFELADEKGNPMEAWPRVDRNDHAAKKPKIPVRLKYALRE